MFRVGSNNIKSLVLMAFAALVLTDRVEARMLEVGPEAAASEPKYTVNEVLQYKLLGMGFEATPEISKHPFSESAKEYIRFRYSRPSSRARWTWIEACMTHKDESVFCKFYEAKRNAPVKNDDSTPGERVSASRAAMAIVRGDVRELSRMKEVSLHQGLHMYSRWQSIESISKKVVDYGGCASPALYVSLGLKGEEFFPDESVRKQVKALYQRASECKSEDPARDKALYRLSLLRIWDGECNKARGPLEELVTKKNNDYSSRALYWKAQCAADRKDEVQKTLTQTRLEDDYPMSYHHLLMNGGDAGVAMALRHEEPNVLFRTSKTSAANPIIRGVEELIQRGNLDAAAELLSSVLDKLDGTELGFRLYVATLFERVGDRIGKFKALSSVFREFPDSITPMALQLYYPLKRFEILERYGSVVDPFLVAALIRQESGFNEHARSPAGALGLMQLMPQTARSMEMVSKRELFDAKTNVRLGVKYFSRLLKRFQEDGELALASYNAGPENVDQWRKRYPVSNRTLFLDLIPFQETREYVALISRNYYWYMKLYSSKLKSKAKRKLASFSLKSNP